MDSMKSTGFWLVFGFLLAGVIAGPHLLSGESHCGPACALPGSGEEASNVFVVQDEAGLLDAGR